MTTFRDDDEPSSRPRLREWRLSRGLGLGELAQLVGVSEDEIASYEDDPRRPMTLKMQLRITKALDITAEQFVDNPPHAGHD